MNVSRNALEEDSQRNEEDGNEQAEIIIITIIIIIITLIKRCSLTRGKLTALYKGLLTTTT